MIEVQQSQTFRKWFDRLKDRRAQITIAARINRLAEGLAGDARPVGEGISELRIHLGPGYRVYFQQRGTILILLLCAGDKSTQSRDIETAKQIANDWSANNG